MNAPILARGGNAGPVVTAGEWGRVGLALGAGLLALGLLFHVEVAASVHTWVVSTAYNHCFLVLPIAVYLLWERRADLVG
ncbi:MAG TPA: archaeosortase/exosortase family protein, partial [Rhodopila sp.]|nr:archaeosortase/exosortase family protein [Rhodopila sp.]